MAQKLKKVMMRKELLLFFILIAAVALGNGLSDSIFANYFKEVYNVTAEQRAFLEIPREMPGLLCALFIAAFGFIGDIGLCLLAQILACVGLVALGVCTPSFGLMMLPLFVNSLGMHLFFPLQDSVGMALAEPDQVGKRMGQYASVKTAVGFAAGILVFVGFRTGFFTLQADVRWVFLVGSMAFLVAALAAAMLVKTMRKKSGAAARPKLVFRKEYRLYYLLTTLHGVQKQIAYVFGTWVIVDLLAKGADITALLVIVSSFCGIFFMNYVGKWIDRFGVKKIMYLDALTFIVIYIIYGFVVWGITAKVLPQAGWSVMLVYVIFVMDRLSMQIGVVKSVYLKGIAVDPAEITATLSTGTSLDHVVSIIAAQLSGIVWTCWGPQWVFFLAALLSLGNLFVAWRVPEKSKA